MRNVRSTALHLNAGENTTTLGRVAWEVFLVSALAERENATDARVRLYSVCARRGSSLFLTQ
jgi:hypothetical protein